MVSTHENITSPVALSEAEQANIRDQLSRMLETHHFKNSKRYPPLLRFIVEETLAGRGDLLKERLLGVRVFDRPADYDTAVDPIVRVTIAEIRKRIAQYYHDEEHDSEIRIELLPGCYTPEFRARVPRHPQLVPRSALALTDADTRDEPLPTRLETPTAPADAAPAAEVTSSQALPAHGMRRLLGRPRLLALLTLLLCAAGGGAFALIRLAQPTPLQQMWQPLLHSPQRVLICLPTHVESRHDLSGTVEPTPLGDIPTPGASTFRDWQALGENVVYSDMLAALRVSSLMAQEHHAYQARLTSMVTFEDMRVGPVVLIGGLDNPWTMRALAPLRYHFNSNDEDRYWIADTQDPSFHAWSLDLRQVYTAVTRDYAIIARLHNQQTGQPQLIVAGIGTSGTAAGGEFVSDPRRLEELAKLIGPHFAERDFEVVLTTDVVNGVAGSPQITAYAIW